MRTVLVDLVRVPRDAAVLFARHWPTLIAVCAAGLGLRLLMVWAAVFASDVHPVLAALILPLAPFAMMAALVAMLRLLRSSMDALGDEADAPPQHQAIIAVMLPFLAVYASQGYLVEDRQSFFAEATYLEAMTGNVLDINHDRVLVLSGVLGVALVLGALVVRKLLIGFELAKRSTRWMVFAIYVEIFWMTLAASLFSRYIKDITAWVESRQAWAWFVDLREQAASYTGIVGSILDATIGAVGSLISQAGTLIVVPVAWLSIGALIYGASLNENKPAAPKRAAVDEPPASVKQRALLEARKRAKAVAADVVSPVTGPVKRAWTAFRKIAVAGVGPMVLFCLVFVLAQQVTSLVAWLARFAIGPQEAYFAFALAPIVLTLERLAYLVVMMTLLAAAINVVVGSLQRNADVVGGSPADAQPAGDGVVGQDEHPPLAPTR